MKVLIIDNIDSFVYNLYQYVGEQGAEVVVKRNHISIEEAEEISPDRIIISPGPGTPENAKNSIPIVKEFGRKIPILGVCLGHQAIGVAFGANVVRAGVIVHGKTSEVTHDGKTIFEGIESPFSATRYHSLAIDKKGFPSTLEISAKSLSDGIIMGIRHKKYPIEGVQFHPESILTGEGKRIIKNFLEGDRSE
ncbi:MAG: aminodeoxychorismate/anthranilate synthase component II [Candidatus Hydrothermarchaeaceae archaeon]